MLGKISANITLATNAPIIAVRRSDPWPLLIAALPSRSHSARTEVRTFREEYIHNPTEKYSPPLCPSAYEDQAGSRCVRVRYGQGRQAAVRAGGCRRE